MRRPPKRQGSLWQQAARHLLRITKLHTDGLSWLMSSFLQGLVQGQLVIDPVVSIGKLLSPHGSAPVSELVGDGAPGRPQKTLV